VHFPNDWKIDECRKEKLVTEQAIVEEDFTILPTVLIRLDHERMEVVTVGKSEETALIVFRSPEDAAGYQEDAPKHTTDEGFELVGMTHVGLAALLEKHGLQWVHMPEPWGSDEPGAFFEAPNFLRMLEESVVED
jgi:hypothetical protein